MVLVLGVSAGTSGARAVLTHSDQPDLPPIDYCYVPRSAGAGLDEPVVAALRQVRDAAERRGELISGTAVACRSNSCADAVRAAQPRLGAGSRIRVVGEAAAQLRYLGFVDRLPIAGLIVLYDLGSSGLTLTLAECSTATVVRTTRNTVLCGDGFDVLLQWKLARLGIVIDAETSRCHREALSIDSVVTAEDRKSGDRAVFTNGDLAELAEPGVAHSLSAVRQLLDTAGDPPSGIVMLGGCSRNRKLADQVATMQQTPVYLEPEPELVSARGAALLAVDKPARVTRMSRVIGAAKPQTGSGEPTSRRKLIAALAVTGALGATIAGLVATESPDSRNTDHAPMEIGPYPPTTAGDHPS